MKPEKRKHAKLSASSCERWWNCPGSVTACAKIPNPPNKYMAEGTVAHAFAERLLKDYETQRVNLEESIGTAVMQEGFEIEVTEEMVDAVLEYADYIRGVCAQNPGAVLKLEQRVELTEIDVDMFGTADCVMVVPFKAVHIFDFKYGQGKRVSAWENKQLLYYALGVMMQEDCTEFTVHICQPRVEDGFTSFTGTSDTIHMFEEELRMKAAEALSPTAPLIPGDWCKSTFCPNRVGCPALSGLAKALVASDFADPTDIRLLSIEHIQKVLKYEDVVKDWMSKVRDHAKELMLQGENIPGYKVVASQGNARWIDEDVVLAEFGDEFGDKMYTKKLISPAQLEKLAGKKRLGQDFREDYTVRPDNGFKIVEEDAKGEPVKTIKPQEDFQ